MKSSILKLIFQAGYLFGNKWTRKLRKSLFEILITFRSGELAKKLAKSGYTMRIEMPCNIIGHRYISIGDHFYAGPRLRLEAHDKYMEEEFTPQIIIGDNVTMNYDCHIGCINKIIIGDNVLMASRIYITDHFHGGTEKKWLERTPINRNLISKGPVIINEGVWIGEGAVVLPGVTIGKNSIVGANAVVTSSFPENSVIGGIPARLIKKID